LLVFVFTSSPLWTREASMRLETAARATMAVLRQTGPLETLPPERLRMLLSRAAEAAEAQGVRVLVLDARGTVGFDSDKAWEGERLELKKVDRAPAVPGRVQGTFLAPTGRRGGTWIFVGQVMLRASDVRQTILFVYPRLRVLGWFTENLLPPLLQAAADTRRSGRGHRPRRERHACAGLRSERGAGAGLFLQHDDRSGRGRAAVAAGL